MSKSGNKILKGVQEAIECSRCNHEEIIISQTKHTGGITIITECRKCGGRFTRHITL